MNEMIEGSAPWSRFQKQAIFGFPLMLFAGLIVSGKAFYGPFGLPLWAKLAIAIPVVLAMLAMIVAPRRSECPDERDGQIRLKATQQAYGFLIFAELLPATLRRLVSEGPPPWDAEGLAMGLAMLAMAVYFGSILLLYRSPAQD